MSEWSDEDAKVLKALERYYGREDHLPDIYSSESPDKIVIAHIDENGWPRLVILAWDEARAWYRRALAYMADPKNEEDVLYWAMVETEPNR